MERSFSWKFDAYTRKDAVPLLPLKQMLTDLVLSYCNKFVSVVSLLNFSLYSLSLYTYFCVSFEFWRSAKVIDHT